MIKCVMGENDGNVNGRPFWQARKQLDLGSAKRVLLKKGDVFIMHQRLATAYGPNATSVASTFVQFHVESVGMHDTMDAFNYSDTPFTGFEGLKHV